MPNLGHFLLSLSDPFGGCRTKVKAGAIPSTNGLSAPTELRAYNRDLLIVLYSFQSKFPIFVVCE